MNECDVFRVDLDALRDGTLDEACNAQLMMHIEDCPTCREEVRRANATEHEIRTQTEQWNVPEHIWQRIQTTVENQHGSKRSSRLKPKPLAWASAAMIVVALLVVNLNFNEPNNQSATSAVASVLVNEFHTFVVSQRQLDFVDTQPSAIRHWFESKLDFRAPLPVKATDFQLEGGRLCNMLDQRVASYMYRSDGAWVSLYIMRSEAMLNEGISDELLLRGYGYIEWKNEGLHYSLIGDISTDRLRQIANTIYSKQISSKAIQSRLPSSALVLTAFEI